MPRAHRAGLGHAGNAGQHLTCSSSNLTSVLRQASTPWMRAGGRPDPSSRWLIDVSGRATCNISSQLLPDLWKNASIDCVMLKPDTKSKVITGLRTHDSDTGSPEVQIGIFTEQIKQLTKHLQE